MKRLKEYIDKHPKLKKIAKIFAVIAIVFSFLFNALIIGSLIINANKSNNNTRALVYDDIAMPVKNEIQKQYNVYYSFGDFSSPLFAEDTFTLLTDPNMTNIGLTGYSSSDFLSGTLITISNPEIVWCTLNSDGESFTQYNTHVFDYVQIQYDTSKNYPVYSINLKMHVNSSNFYFNFRYGRYSIYDNDNNLTYSNWSSACSGFDETYYAVYMSFAKTNQFNWLGTGNAVFNDYYNQGYNDGYNLGYGYGYDTGEDYGYDQGYYDGLQSAEQGETTMFSLISQAFNAVASILDIQVLPNLSLGLLIFTPLIVTIIIVVVKMVKG